MLIFDNNNDAIILDNIHTPTTTEHFWVLDLDMLDFTLTPLSILEEITSPSIQVLINNFEFILPASWNILICDSETMQIDVVEISEIAGNHHEVMLYGPNHSMVETSTVSATNYYPSYVNVAPSLNKYQMLCHPVAPNTWVNIAPSDTYNKYLKNRIAGDLV